jgi:hypothetical protein
MYFGPPSVASLRGAVQVMHRSDEPRSAILMRHRSRFSSLRQPEIFLPELLVTDSIDLSV